MTKYLLVTFLFITSCGATVTTEVKRSNNCTSLSGDCSDCLSSLWNKGEDKPDRKNCFACAQYDACTSNTLPSNSGNGSTKDEEDSNE